MSSNDSSSSASKSPSSSEQPPEKKKKIEHDKISVGNWEPLLESDEYEIVHHSTDSSSDDEEDMEEYEAAVKASDGFDVPEPTGPSFCGRIVPMTPLDDHSREMLSSLSSAALEHYNEEHHTNYQFLELVKANEQGCMICVYYITFVGGIPGVNTTKIFQARVSAGFPGEEPVEVYICREKASQGALLFPSFFPLPPVWCLDDLVK
ncbi:hypothetical protein PTKIN_Ptkin02bG0008600 [Pterospermum kingtungense]